MNVNELFTSKPWYMRLAAIRVLRGWTKQEAANKIGASYFIYKRWENGLHQPLENNRRAICRVMGVPQEFIFGEVDKQ
jgi:DNA-binding XRE family transcriptional regulator